MSRSCLAGAGLHATSAQSTQRPVSKTASIHHVLEQKRKTMQTMATAQRAPSTKSSTSQNTLRSLTGSAEASDNLNGQNSSYDYTAEGRIMHLPNQNIPLEGTSLSVLPSSVCGTRSRNRTCPSPFHPSPSPGPPSSAANADLVTTKSWSLRMMYRQFSRTRHTSESDQHVTDGNCASSYDGIIGCLDELADRVSREKSEQKRMLDIVDGRV